MTGGVQLVLSVFDRRRNARVAARLLYMHLWWARQSMEAAFDDGRWNRNIDWETFNAAWEGQRTALAYALRTKDFLMVESAFTVIEQLSMTRANDLDDPNPSTFTLIRSDYATVYRSHVKRAILIVNRASFTRWERRRGLHKPAEREIEGGVIGASGKNLGLLAVTNKPVAPPTAPIPDDPTGGGG